MHACGIAHGDVKMANVVRVEDGYWLGDLPALTRATTKMLTNDPISSTLLISGKRYCGCGCGWVWLCMVVGVGTVLGACLFGNWA